MIEIISGDITQLKVDAIVNAANKSLLGGGGVDGAIHRAAGSGLLEECRQLGGCDTGDAKITKGYCLKASHVIHTVGPVWHGGQNDEEALLKSCYLKSLDVLLKNNLKTIAFPCISTGIYHFPKTKAAAIALKTVRQYLKDAVNIEKVFFVCFDNENYDIYRNLVAE